MVQLVDLLVQLRVAALELLDLIFEFMGFLFKLVRLHLLVVDS